MNTSGKFSKQNTHRKDGLTVFAELNMGGELCKKDKLSSICDASSVSYFYFVLCRLSCISKRKVERVFKFEHERKAFLKTKMKGRVVRV